MDEKRELKRIAPWLSQASNSGRYFAIAMAVFWAGWLAYEVSANERIWLSIFCGLWLWHWQIREHYMTWMRTRYVVIAYIEGCPIAARECAFGWSATRAAKSLQKEWGWLSRGLPTDKTFIQVQRVSL